MRIASLDQIKHLGKSAQKQIMKALNEEKIRPTNNSSDSKIESDSSSNHKAKKNIDETESTKTVKPLSRIMKTEDGRKYCPWPSADPAVVVHKLLEDRFGNYWEGGEIVSEMIIPGGPKNWRMDWVHLPTRLCIEMDGFQFHRTLDAFKNDRAKQCHALMNGFIVHRITNEDIRKRPEQIIPCIEQMIKHRPLLPYSVHKKGYTQCVFEF
jgi:hypothetical protein